MHAAKRPPTASAGCAAGYFFFFGRCCCWWHLLQRTCCVLMRPPHLGQRRALSFCTKSVRGRIPMGVLSFNQNSEKKTETIIKPRPLVAQAIPRAIHRGTVPFSGTMRSMVGENWDSPRHRLLGRLDLLQIRDLAGEHFAPLLCRKFPERFILDAKIAVVARAAENLQHAAEVDIALVNRAGTFFVF